jgi:hypothetical protein
MLACKSELAEIVLKSRCFPLFAKQRAHGLVGIEPNCGLDSNRFEREKVKARSHGQRGKRETLITRQYRDFAVSSCDPIYYETAWIAQPLSAGCA